MELVCMQGLTIHWSSDLQNKCASWDQPCPGLDSVTIDIAAPKAKHVYMWIWKSMTEKRICVCSSTWTAPVFLGFCKMNSHTAFSSPTDVVWSAADSWSSCPDSKAPLWPHSAPRTASHVRTTSPAYPGGSWGMWRINSEQMLNPKCKTGLVSPSYMWLRTRTASLEEGVHRLWVLNPQQAPGWADGSQMVPFRACTCSSLLTHSRTRLLRTWSVWRARAIQRCVLHSVTFLCEFFTHT